jgi:hypothetical protein
MNTLIKLPNFPVSICTQDGELTDKEIKEWFNKFKKK